MALASLSPSPPSIADISPRLALLMESVRTGPGRLPPRGPVPLPPYGRPQPPG
jgi:hypothetical protein